MIELQGISQTCPRPSGPVEVLRGIDMKVGIGEIFGVIGRSGRSGFPE